MATRPGLSRWTPFRERLFSRLIIDPETGCLNWTGTKTPEGYGKISRDGKLVGTHRAMYEMFAGPIPEGLHLDHLCRNPACANVAHLEPVTVKENVARGRNALRSHCVKGHPYDEANTGHRARGDRYCRACMREYQRAHYVPRRRQP
jgi:HNH endonuclease